MSDKDLFSDLRLTFGGLSNSEQLRGLCPTMFKHPKNPWHQYALQFKYLDSEEIQYQIVDWEWNTNHKPTQTKQLNCVLGIWSTSNKKMASNDINAVLGWMFSKMLKVIPKESPFEKARSAVK